VKQYTLATGAGIAGLLMILGAQPALAGSTDPGDSTTTFTKSTSSKTFIHDTQVNINNYVTRVLGLATWDGPGDYGHGFTNKEVYDNTINSPAGSQEVTHAYNDAVNEVTKTLDSTGGRGQIQISSDTQVQTDSSSKTVEDGRTNTVTKTTELTFGPDTILIGDRDTGGTTYILATGETNFNTNTHTQIDIDTTTTTTTDTKTTYTVSGELYSSPIVLDLSGSGKIAASNGNWQPHPKAFYKDHRVMFDFFGNGFPVAMEWVGPTDGLLVHPKADGTVDGTCLFGNATGYNNGYEQLATLDVNMDGHVSGKELSGLSVWQDKNGNGKCNSGE